MLFIELNMNAIGVPKMKSV